MSCSECDGAHALNFHFHSNIGRSFRIGRNKYASEQIALSRTYSNSGDFIAGLKAQMISFVICFLFEAMFGVTEFSVLLFFSHSSLCFLIRFDR